MELIIAFKDMKRFYRQRCGDCDMWKGVVTPMYSTLNYGGSNSTKCYRKGFW